MKHSPGPWFVVLGENCCFHGNNRCAICYYPEGLPKEGDDPENIQMPTLAEVWPTQDDSDIADAYLIAASPLLLECCQKALRTFEHFRKQGICIQGDVIAVPMAMILTDLTEAIEKATTIPPTTEGVV